MSIIVSNCQHCDKQQFQTLSCIHYTIFSVVKLDLFIRALLLDCILALEKNTRTPHVHLVNCKMTFCKIINGLESVETEDILKPDGPRTRKNHTFKFKHIQANCD